MMDGRDRDRLKEIFTEALALDRTERERFLAERCGEDSELCVEARRLVFAHESEDSFLSVPAIARLVKEEEPIFEPDRVLAGRFRIVRFIARGGMGEVYEAEDLLLGERVALKTLRRGGRNPEELALLKQEIQSARRVTHPNICRTFEVAENEDPPVTLFTMELLEGPTLSQHLRSEGPFGRSEALPLIQQIAAGLQAAHDAGVIHRDFKSGNVILTRGSNGWRPVITDFGLAFTNLSQPLAPLPRAGTPGYVAPEQVEGHPATTAADVYALGVVIARLIGARQSAGQSWLPSQSRPVPEDAGERRRLGPWKSVVERCLEKDPAKRYQRPADVVAALITLEERPGRLVRRVALAVLAIVTIAGVWQVSSLRFERHDPVVSSSRVKRQIMVRDNEQAWQLSPDGTSVILTDVDSRNLVLYDVASGKRRAVLPPTQSAQETVAYPQLAIFSPTGDHLAYLWQQPDATAQLRSVRIDGADRRTLFSDPQVTAVAPQDWSPDGRRILAYVRWRDGQSQYIILSASDGSVVHETPRATDVLGSAVFHRDGRQVVFQTLQKGSQSNWDILLFTPGTGTSPMVRHPASDTLIGWTEDRRQLVFISNRGGSAGIWALPFSVDGKAGQPRQLLLDVGSMQPFGLSNRGSLLYSVTQTDMNVYTAEIDVEAGRLVSGPRPVEWPFEGYLTYPSWSPDGRSLACVAVTESASGTIMDIYTRETAKSRRVVFPEVLVGRAQWFGGTGWLVAPGRDAQGRKGLFRLNPATGEHALLLDQRTLGPVLEGIWSDDGKVHFNRYTDFKKGMFRLDLQTGARRTLYVPKPGENLGRENLALSPDERILAFQLFSMKDKTSRLILIPANGGVARPLWTVHQPDMFWPGSFAWSRDGRYILAARTRKGKSEIWRVPADGSLPTRINFPAMPMMMILRLNRDGRTVAFSSGELEKSELWLLDHLVSAVDQRTDTK